MSATIQISSGKYWDVSGPELSIDKIDIHVIAHSLAHICRFTGHVRKFYTVAQHSVLCSHVEAEDHAYAKLMHDIAESLLGDVSTPLKRLLPEYREWERKTEVVLFNHFGLPVCSISDFLNPEIPASCEHPDLPPGVKKADYILLVTEKRDLLPAHPDDVVEWHWSSRIKPLKKKIKPWGAIRARHMFLARFYELCPERFLKRRRITHVAYHRLVAVINSFR